LDMTYCNCRDGPPHNLLERITTKKIEVEKERKKTQKSWSERS